MPSVAMQISVTESAPCKLNLHLCITGVRSDGFHSIESLFQTLSLEDRVTVREAGSTGSLEFLCGGMELPARNTLTKAAELFRERTGDYRGLRIELEKVVPAGAGLGGGSSDGAAVLRALNQLCGEPLGIQDLLELAEGIGSDVPFFVRGGAALVSGRGERVEPIRPRDDLSAVIIWPSVASPTPAAYRLYDEWLASGNVDPASRLALGDLESEYRKSPGAWEFANSFTPPLGRAVPEIAAALADIVSGGPEYSGMSGSGSAVFAIYDDPEKGARAASILAEKWRFCGNFLLLAR